MFHLSEMY